MDPAKVAPWFLPASLVAVVFVAATALVVRGRPYATFRGVLLTVYSLVATALLPVFEAVMPAYLYLHGAVFFHSAILARPRMMPLPYRALVSIPASFFAAGTLLALPWAVLHAVGFNAWGAWLPHVVALVGVVQSLSARRAEEVDVVVGDGHAVDAVSRHRSPKQRVGRPLRIFQITDPHLGPFMSQARLRRICERAVRREPDLVLLTGDFLTMESQSDPAVLAHGLEPLRALSGRVFACMGNHDHEAPATVSEALRRVGATLLIDEAAELETAAGRVQIVGIDFRWRGRRQHIQEVCAAFPRKPDALRVVLLHDPSAFHHVPDGDADLVFSGHTHGGQVGLLSIGLPFTMLRLFVRSPDHGLWAFGRNRLYVHRGTGHYGFPLRVGVPAEESIVRVHDARLVAPAE